MTIKNFIYVYTKDGSAFACEESQEDILMNALYTGRVDVVALKLLSGGMLVIRIPEIQSWSLSTPEIREMQSKISIALDGESANHRMFQ